MSTLAVTLAADGAATVGLATELFTLKEIIFLFGEILRQGMSSDSISGLCGEVSSGACLTLVSGSSDSGRTGFTLSESSSFSVPRIVTALACAALRSRLLSCRDKLTERLEDLELERRLTALLFLLCLLNDLVGERPLQRRGEERRWRLWPYLWWLSHRQREESLWQRG